MTLARRNGLQRGGARLSSTSGLEGRAGLSCGQGGFTAHPKSAGLLFEEEVAELYEDITGRRAFRQRGSGSVWFRPGDVLTPEFLIECKERARPVIRHEWLARIDMEADAYARTPLLAFREKDRGRTWGVLSTMDLPEPDHLPRPDRIVRGGTKQATVPREMPGWFYLGFREIVGPAMLLYAVYPLHEVFKNAGLWQDGLEIPELSRFQG